MSKCQSVIVSCVILSFLGASLCFAQVNDEEEDFLFAKKAFSDGFYALAQENLEDFLDRYPATEHLYEAHLLLGRSLYYQNNFKKAYSEFEIVLSSPNASGSEDGALYWMGNIYYRGGDFKKSLESYQKILDEYPASKYCMNAAYSKAWSYYKMGLFEDAMIIFADISAKYQFEKTGMESLFNIGECQYLLLRYEDAENSLKSFNEKYPLSDKTAESYYLIGDIKFRQGDFADSINYFNRAVAISSFKAKWHYLALYRMAQGYFEIKDYDESLKKFEESMKASKDTFLISNSLIGMARSYKKKGLVQDSLKICDDIIAKFPRSDASSEAYYIKAKILSDQKRYKEAKAICAAGIDRFSAPAKTGKLHYELGCIYLKEDKFEDALTEFKIAVENLESGALVSSAICGMGDIYFEKGDFDTAMERYDLVLKSYADSQWADHAQFMVGIISLKNKRYDQAILAFQSALTNFPNTLLKDKAVFYLGMAYFNRGDFARSCEEFKKLSTIESKFYLANSLYNLNRYEEALELFMWVIKNSADKSLTERSQYQSGWCYYRMGKEMDAVSNFDLFIKKYPDSKFSKDASDTSVSILLKAAENFEKWKMPEDAARLYEKLEALKH